MKKIITIVLAVIFCGWVCGKFLDYRYKKFWHPVFEKLDVVFGDTSKQDIVFLGDSRVHFGINPYYTDSVTGLKTFNLGMAASSVYEMYLLTEAWLAKHPAPQLFVISIGHSGMLQSSSYFGNPCYYFYYLDNPVIKDALSNQYYHTNLFRIFPILKYTAFDEYNKTSIFRSYTDGLLKPGGICYKGFINNTSNIFNLQTLMLNEKNPDTACSVGIKKFADLLELFKKHNTRCLIIYPPTIDYASLKKHNPYIEKIDSIISRLSIFYNDPVLHFEKDSTFTSSMFFDQFHVNINGSIFYSKKLGDSINWFLNKRPWQ